MNANSPIIVAISATMLAFAVAAMIWVGFIFASEDREGQLAFKCGFYLFWGNHTYCDRWHRMHEIEP